MMDFGDAIRALKAGKRVARAGWNGKGMWLTHVSEWNAAFGCDLPPDWSASPFIAMKTVNNEMVPWLASQSDVLSEDWDIVEGDTKTPVNPLAVVEPLALQGLAAPFWNWFYPNNR